MEEYAITVNHLTAERSGIRRSGEEGIYRSSFFLRDLTFALPKGCITGLIGRNGAGKSTLIEVLAGALPYQSGSLSFEGQQYDRDGAKIRRRLSVVYDEPNFSRRRTPVSLAAWIRRREPWFDEAYFRRNLERFWIDPKKQVREMSMGTIKKLQLILLMSRRPEILLLDEPTTGVDPYSRHEMRDLLLEFMEEETHTILFSTHVTTDLDRIADYVMMVDDGKLMFQKEKEALRKEMAAEGDTLPTIREIMQRVCRDSGAGQEVR